MNVTFCNSSKLVLQKTNYVKLGLSRPCVSLAGQSYPRQRNLDIMCSAQSVSGGLRQQQPGSRKDRLHVIALISEAVSVNVSRGNPSQPSTAISIGILLAADSTICASDDAPTREKWCKGSMVQRRCHCCHHLPCGADCDLWFLQAAVQRFETLAGRSAMVRACIHHLIKSDSLLIAGLLWCQYLVFQTHTHSVLRAKALYIVGSSSSCNALQADA